MDEMKKARKQAKRKTLIQWLDRSWSKVTGRAHNYHVVFGYKQKGQKLPAQVTMCQTFTMTWRPGHDAFYREIKQEFGPAMIKAAGEAYGKLNSGHITIEVITYLGRH